MSTAIRTPGAAIPVNHSRIIVERPLPLELPRLTPRLTELLGCLNREWDDRQPSVYRADAATACG